MISILFLFVATVALAEPETPRAPPPLVVALRAHRDELRALAVGSIGTSEIDAILAQPIDDDMTAKRRADAAHGVASLGAQARGAWWITGFIDNEAATRVLGAGLLDEDAQVRESACSELDSLGKDEYLGAIAADIETAAPTLPRECGARLLGRLRIDLAEARRLLGRPLIIEVAARLGDTRAESAMIEAFEKAGDFRAKEKSADGLGYVGTPAAGAALVRALHSPIIRGSGIGDRVSVRIPIILALGRIHQNQMLLFAPVMRIAQIGDGPYGGAAAIAAYLTSVEEWARSEYGISPEGRDPGPFLMDVENTPVMR